MVTTGTDVPLHDWLPWVADIPGATFAFVLVMLAVGIAFSDFLIRLLGRPVAQRFSRESVTQTVLRAIRLATILGAVMFGLWAIGVRFTDVLLIGTVLSAVTGIILAPLIGNFINGIFILADQPYEIGDMIELDDGTFGFVDDITIRYTKVFTLDNTFLVVPNGNMRDRDVINFSAEDERSRQTIEVLVTYESDISEGRRLIERAAQDCEAIIDGGPDIRIGIARYNASPDCRIHDFGDDGILLRLRYWVKKPYKLMKVQSEVNTRIRELFADADVEMAYPHRHLVFDDTSGFAQVSMGSPPVDAGSEDGSGAAGDGGTADFPTSADDGGNPTDTVAKDDLTVADSPVDGSVQRTDEQ